MINKPIRMFSLTWKSATMALLELHGASISALAIHSPLSVNETSIMCHAQQQLFCLSFKLPCLAQLYCITCLDVTFNNYLTCY